MQLGIQNFASGGNNLMFMNDWNKYQEKLCKSKSMIHCEESNLGLFNCGSTAIATKPGLLQMIKDFFTHTHIYIYIAFPSLFTFKSKYLIEFRI